jgi:myo-inositol-1(or 4)-monophosphatase
MTTESAEDLLKHIHAALSAAVEGIRPFVPGAVSAAQKSGGRGPVTEADHAADRILRESLLREGEGWLSEETADDLSRLSRGRVWVVDPLDGTREFVEGVPEWCLSVGYIEDGRAVAGGICNPATGEVFLGSRETGVTWNGTPVKASERQHLAGATVLASRTETQRGEWKRFEGDGLTIVPMGSVAYKLARVAAGLADATWTLSPKNEWDVAAGVALIEAAGGVVCTLEDKPVEFNRQATLYSGLIAGGTNFYSEMRKYLDASIQEALSTYARS